MTINVILLFFIIPSCKEKHVNSVFQYFPNSKGELLVNGYEYMDKVGMFIKHAGDTTDNVSFDVDKSIVVSKFVCIRRDMTEGQPKTDSLKSISVFVMKNVGQTVIDIDDIIKIMRIDGQDFFVSFNYSSLKTQYIVNFDNLSIQDKRKSNIDFLKRWKAHYTDELVRNRIDSAIRYINANHHQ